MLTGSGACEYDVGEGDVSEMTRRKDKMRLSGKVSVMRKSRGCQVFDAS